MKPDLLRRPDEPYGPPNLGLSCAGTPVSKKDLDIDTVHKLSPRLPPPSSFPPPSQTSGEKENKAVAMLATSQSAESNL